MADGLDFSSLLSNSPSGAGDFSPAMPNFNQAPATQGPLSAGAPSTSWLSKLGLTGPQGTDVLGMNPANFATILGQLASTIGGTNTLGGRLGALATSMGTAKLQSVAAEHQHKQLTKMLSDLFAAHNTTDPTTIANSSLSNILNNSPADFYKTLAGTVSPTTPATTPTT